MFHSPAARELVLRYLTNLRYVAGFPRKYRRDAPGRPDLWAGRALDVSHAREQNVYGLGPLPEDKLTEAVANDIRYAISRATVQLLSGHVEVDWDQRDVGKVKQEEATTTGAGDAGAERKPAAATASVCTDMMLQSYIDKLAPYMRVPFCNDLIPPEVYIPMFEFLEPRESLQCRLVVYKKDHAVLRLWNSAYMEVPLALFERVKKADASGLPAEYGCARAIDRIRSIDRGLEQSFLTRHVANPARVELLPDAAVRLENCRFNTQLYAHYDGIVWILHYLMRVVGDLLALIELLATGEPGQVSNRVIRESQTAADAAGAPDKPAIAYYARYVAWIESALAICVFIAGAPGCGRHPDMLRRGGVILATDALFAYVSRALETPGACWQSGGGLCSLVEELCDAGVVNVNRKVLTRPFHGRQFDSGEERATGAHALDDSPVLLDDVLTAADKLSLLQEQRSVLETSVAAVRDSTPSQWHRVYLWLLFQLEMYTRTATRAALESVFVPVPRGSAAARGDDAATEDNMDADDLYII